VEGYDIKTCELFDRNCRIIQYFNCQRYSYIKKACRKRITCGFYTKNHNTKNCETKKDQSKKNCVIYKNKDYKAWLLHCPVKKKKKKKQKKRFLTSQCFIPYIKRKGARKKHAGSQRRILTFK